MCVVTSYYLFSKITETSKYFENKTLCSNVSTYNFFVQIGTRIVGYILSVCIPLPALSGHVKKRFQGIYLPSRSDPNKGFLKKYAISRLRWFSLKTGKI